MSTACGFAAFEPGPNREHAAMIVGLGEQAELAEDAPDVRLDGLLGEREPLGDGSVRSTFGHCGEDVLLTCRQGVDAIARASTAEELGDDVGIEDCAAGGNGGDGFGEHRYVEDVVLEEIAEPLWM